jgi:Flp pilus assembly secretin CpaC
MIWVCLVEIQPGTCTGFGGLTMTTTLRAFLVGVTLLLATNSVTRAADRTITLKLGAGSAFELQRPFKTVLIGDPDIVDVHTRSDRSVILEPLNPGATNLVFVDDRSIAITNVRIMVCSAGAIRVKYDDGPECD